MNVKAIEFKIYKNILKYLQVLGHDVIADDGKQEMPRAKDDIVKTLQFYSYIKIKSVHPVSGIMYIFIVQDSSIVSKSAEFKNNIFNTIPEKKFILTVVSRDGIKIQVHKFINKYTKKNVVLNDFRYTVFKDDLRNNVMVPKHELCTDAEKVKILKDNFITDDSYCPGISKNDMQVIWTGGKPGQLMRITRNDITGPVIYYRIILHK
jgi:DNA-directed RNA polymerase subunit H (RpoH/RPB5)